jgi:hypothetical protein
MIEKKLFINIAMFVQAALALIENNKIHYILINTWKKN